MSLTVPALTLTRRQAVATRPPAAFRHAGARVRRPGPKAKPQRPIVAISPKLCGPVARSATACRIDKGRAAHALNRATDRASASTECPDLRPTSPRPSHRKPPSCRIRPHQRRSGAQRLQNTTALRGVQLPYGDSRSAAGATTLMSDPEVGAYLRCAALPSISEHQIRPRRRRGIFAACGLPQAVAMSSVR